MSTEQDDKAVRDAIAGAEIGEARPAMTTKRPWTEHVTWDKCPCGCDLYQLGNQRFGVFSEPDARLFAAAPAMYEALDAAVGVINQLYQKLGTVPADELADITATVIGITAQLRAANPDAFTPNVQASEPAGEMNHE